MKKTGRILSMGYGISMLALILISLSAATYAWFTSNSIVATDRVSGRTGTDRVTLLISGTGGNDFRGASETAIVQVNQTAATSLLPVSTADLRNFVFNDGSVDQSAVHFTRVTDEKYYYHGRVYLQAAAEGMQENTRLSLYLDQADGTQGPVRNAQGYMINASRLGLTFDGGNVKILRLSEAGNPDQERRVNTVLNGTALQADQVIDASGDTLRAVQDPSVLYRNFAVNADGMPDGSASPLFVMELNRIYALDIYFYVEGCDPDCTDTIQTDFLDLQLSLYGIVTEEGR